MRELLRIAARNLYRYKRRTVLASLLVAVGVVSLLLSLAVGSAFKSTMVGIITDGMMGQMQVHHKGYVASLDNLPLNLQLKPEQVRKSVCEKPVSAGCEPV